MPAGDAWFEEGEFIHELRTTAAERSWVRRVVEDGDAEPMGHTLYREAWAQQDQNPRSALVVGVAGFEVGVKQCIARLVPEARWLIEYSPSPPVPLILRKYLPMLACGAECSPDTLLPSKPILRILDEAVECRNAVVHRGAPPPDPATLRTMLLAIRHILYLVDGYSGHAWAFTYSAGVPAKAVTTDAATMTAPRRHR